MKWLRRLWPIVLLLLAPILARAATPQAPRELHVYAAASLADAFGELGRAMEARTPGLRVRFHFGGSQALAMQLAQGAKGDVFASADERWMQDAAGHALLEGDAAAFARNRLVVIVPRTNPGRIGSLRDLARGGLKLVLGADAVPVGRYARVALRQLGADPALGPDYASRVLRNVVSEDENVKSVVGKVQLGEADAGIVYASDVTPAAARFVRAIEIPTAANVIATYPIAVLRGAPRPEDARAFVALVRSDEGQRVLAKWKFLPAEAGR